MRGLCANLNGRGAWTLRSTMLVNLLLASTAPCYAGGVLPSGGQVVAGSGAIATAGNALTVTQSSTRAIINWQSFSIGNGNSVQINNGSGATLNRVIANSPSTIAGSLTSTGSTYLINQNGIVVTPTGKVVTGGSFIGSTRDTGDNSFMQGGAQQFTGASSGNVVNQGKIVSISGDVVLVGKSADNSGVVSARKGTAGLVAGDDVTLQPSGTGLQIKVAAGTGDASNSGTVDAAQVMLNAAGGNVYALAGNNGGTIRATGTSTINGHVWLTAGGQASVTGSVSAQNADGSGGAIAVAGRNIDISGTLDASALSSFGSGGSASVIATDTTQVTGAIKARAGSRGGNGGAIETSGNSLLIAGAAIDASAPAGLAGAWLLDPYNLTVVTAPSSATQAPTGTWTSNAGGGLVLNTDINSALNAGTSVVLQTSGTLGDGQGNGDITVAAPILMTGASNASLTLLAAGSINIFQTISSTGGTLGVTLNANTLGGGGAVNIGSAISTNGGDLVVGGGANPLTSPAVGTAGQNSGITVSAALTAGAGAITLNGKGFSGGLVTSMGVSVNAPISGGAISITGTGGDSSSNANYGVYINGAISGAGGAIAITGTAGNSSGIGNNGIYQNANISNTGTGSITLNGTGGGSGIGADGVFSLANIIAATGNIAITGHGGAAAQNANGAVLHGTTISTGGAGTITISGTATGTATGTSVSGVTVDIPTITAADGLISITGINNSISTSGGNMGVLLLSGRHVTSTGVGGVSLMGLAGGSGASSNNSGVVLNDANTVQSTGGGAITITGTGGDNGGSGTFNAGVLIGAQVVGALAGSGGAISITGTGGNSSGINNYGIFQNSAITNTGTGSISLNGAGGGSGNNESGYFSTRDVTAGTGNIAITGAASASATGNANGGIVLSGGSVSTGGSGTITLFGTGTGSGAGNSAQAAVNIGPGSLTAVDGLISVTGISNSLLTGANSNGVTLFANNIKSNGTGGVTIVGSGGGSGAGGNNVGVFVNSATAIQATGGGAISITGTGGDSGGSGSSNYGVFVNQALSGNGGAISITGTGGNSSGTNNYGIFQTAAITNTGTGGISLNGSGGGSGNNELGYFATAAVTAGTGNIAITGAASATATGGSNGGIVLANPSAAISTGGAGTITLLGTGTGSGATSASFGGVNLGAGSVAAVNGLISITGISNSVLTGGGSTGVNLNSNNIKSTGIGGVRIVGFGGGSGAGGNNVGVAINSATAVQVTGGGTITITGTGGDGGGSGGSNYGVLIGQALSGSGGTISITGSGGNSSGSDNYGIFQTAAITNTGTGNIILNGTGGGTGLRERGFVATNTTLTAGTGDISITGAASSAASGANNDGINLASAVSTGGGNITLSGTATGTGAANNGDAGVFLLSGSISAATGLISITGTNNSMGTGQGHDGVFFLSGPGNRINAGSGGVTITGFGGGTGSGGFNFGVLINGIQSTGGGAVTVTGIGGGAGGSGNSNYGVSINQDLSGSGGELSISGTGGNSSGANNYGIFQVAAAASTISNTGTGGITLSGTPGGGGNLGMSLGKVATPGGTITMNSTGFVGGGPLISTNLNLLGVGGIYDFNTNINVSTAVTALAANTGSVIFIQDGDLTIGTVGSTAGVTVSGTVKLVSNSGNLSIASGAGVSAAGTGNALILEAGASTAQPNPTGGDFINNAGPGALSTPNGFWLVYTGHKVGSGTVDGGLSYTAQYGTDTSYTPPPSANFMFFRAAPSAVTAALTGTVIKTYDGTLLATLGAGNYNLSGIAPADLSSVTLTVNGTAISMPTYGLFSTKNTGNGLLVTVSGLGLNQPANAYFLTATTISANIGTINPALLTISAAADSRTYNGTTSSTGAPTVSGLFTIGGDSVTGLSQDFGSKNVLGSNGSTLSVSGYLVNDGNGGANYTVSLNTAIGTITPASLTISAVSDSKVYDGTTSSSATPAVSGLFTVGGDSVTGLSQAFASKNVLGTNGSTLSVTGYAVNDGNGGNNYTVDASATAMGTITPATLIYTANSASKTYGKSNPKLGGALNGLQGGDTQTMVASGKLKFNTGATKSSNVGSYAVNGSGLHVISANYFTAIDQDAANATALTITPAKLTYKADKASRTYGAADPVFSGTVTGFVLGQTLATATTGTMAFTTTAIDASNVGKYAIDGSGLAANFGNYYFVQATGNAKALTIDPAILTYVADPASRPFHTVNPLFTGTVTGFVLGQDLASATTGTLEFKSPAKKNSHVGSYAIKGSGLSANNGNYVFVQAAGNATALAVTP